MTSDLLLSSFQQKFSVTEMQALLDQKDKFDFTFLVHLGNHFIVIVLIYEKIQISKLKCIVTVLDGFNEERRVSLYI
jgi:hypothetical protein